MKLSWNKKIWMYRLDYYVYYTFKLYACVILLKYTEQNYQIATNVSKLRSARYNDIVASFMGSFVWVRWLTSLRLFHRRYEYTPTNGYHRLSYFLHVSSKTIVSFTKTFPCVSVTQSKYNNQHVELVERNYDVHFRT